MPSLFNRFTKLNSNQKFLTIQSVLAAVVIALFGFWRFARSEWQQGWFDMALAVMFAGVAHLCMQNRHVRIASFISVFIYMAAVMAVVHWFGHGMLFWIFPAFVGSFFAVRAHEAMLICLISTALNAWFIQGQVSPFELTTFVATAVLVCIFTYLFANRMWKDNLRWQAAATTDPLTQTGNRRSLDDALTEITSSTSAQPWTLLMLDIDHFKEVNDSFGHDTGDRCLKRMAEEIQRLLSKEQKLFRLGGEEFVVLMPGDATRGAALAEKLRAHLEQTRLIREKTVTVSFGVAERPPALGPREWLRMADDALYQAKHEGRNCVRISQSPQGIWTETWPASGSKKAPEPD